MELDTYTSKEMHLQLCLRRKLSEMSEPNISQQRKNNFAFNDVVLLFLVNMLKIHYQFWRAKGERGLHLESIGLCNVHNAKRLKN